MGSESTKLQQSSAEPCYLVTLRLELTSGTGLKTKKPTKAITTSERAASVCARIIGTIIYRL